MTEDHDYMVHMAWLIGGSSAAQALIREVSLAEESWGAGDDEKAVSLTKVGTMHMISVWFRSIEPDADAKENARETAASSIIPVINKLLWTGDEAAVRTVRDVDGFLNMDVQWNWESNTEGQPWAYAALLLARPLEACGQPCADWGKVAFPVTSVKQLLNGGAILDPLEPHVSEGSETLPAVITCMDEGVRAMRRYHDVNMEGKVRPPVGH